MTNTNTNTGSRSLPSDAEVDATARLVRSISSSTDHTDHDDQRHLLPLARRILSSSVGGQANDVNNTAGAISSSNDNDRLVRRRMEKSYRRSRLAAAGIGGDTGTGNTNRDDPVQLQSIDRDVQRTMAEVDTLCRRLADAEDRHHRSLGSSSGSNGSQQQMVANKVVMALSRLVGTEGWEGLAGVSATSAAAGTSAQTSSDEVTDDTGSSAALAAAEKAQTATTVPSAPEPSQSIETRTVLYEEVLTLRDCLFALQGIDSERVRFHEDGPSSDTTATEGASSSWTDAARDCPGVRINLHLLPFQTTVATQMGVRSQRVLGSGSMDALRVCGETGWLYRRVLAYVDGVRGNTCNGGGSGSSGGGAVARALASALSTELAEYHRLISVLEAQLTSQISSCSTTSSSEEVPKKLTARQLMVHLRPAMCRLRTLATVVDSLPNPTGVNVGGKQCSGGKLITAIQQHSRHGDTRHSTLLHSLASKAAEPWFDVLWHWTTNGTLPVSSAMSSSALAASSTGASSIGGREFFVAEDLSVSDDQLWHGRFILLRDNVPLGVVTMDLAERALVLGKGINFIRSCLGDVSWELDLTVLGSIEQDARQRARLGYSYDPTAASTNGGRALASISNFGTAAAGMEGDKRTCKSNVNLLDSSISRMAEQVNAHILHTLRNRHHLQTHLWALKQFLFLGRGDFVSALLDGLHRELDPRSNDARRVGSGEMDGVYVHTLMSVMEIALRTTNAKHLPPYVLGRLRVDLVTVSDQVRPDAWDAFHLAYDVNAPLTAVVHPEAALLYRRVFALLFRLKRIVYMLNRTWRQSTALHHALRQIALAYPDSPASSKQRTLLLLRRVALTRQSILHFASNLQSYLMFEVVEGGYEVMANRVARATSLDEVIAAHDDYLNEIVRKSLIVDDGDEEDGVTAMANGVNEVGVEGTPATASPMKEQSLGRELAKVLDASLRFCRVHSAMFETALKSVDIAARKRRAAERRAKAGGWGYDNVDKDVDGSNLFDSLSDERQVLEVESIADEFDVALGKLLKALDRTLNEGPPRSASAAPGKSLSGGGQPWWQRNGGSNGFGVHAYGSLAASSTMSMNIPPAWSNDDSLRFLAFRLDFNEYYDGRQVVGAGTDEGGGED